MGKIEEMCAPLIGNRASISVKLPGLPGDIEAALNSAIECLAATIAVTMMSTMAGLRSQEWKTAEKPKLALERLKTSTSELRVRLIPIALELSAAHETVAQFGMITYSTPIMPFLGLRQRQSKQ